MLRVKEVTSLCSCLGGIPAPRPAPRPKACCASTPPPGDTVVHAKSPHSAQGTSGAARNQMALSESDLISRAQSHSAQCLNWMSRPLPRGRHLLQCLQGPVRLLPASGAQPWSVHTLQCIPQLPAPFLPSASVVSKRLACTPTFLRPPFSPHALPSESPLPFLCADNI